MTPQQKQLIRELVLKYSEQPGSESLLAYIAETNGMLTACKKLLQTIKTGDSVGTDWLFRDCLKYNVVFHLFLEEISRLVVLFDPNQENEDHFATLGLTPGAGKDEIKQAYRTLSPQYHPDTASPIHRDQPEKFIAINKAYNALLTAQDTEESNEKNTPSKQWRKSRVRRSSIGQKKKLYVWASATLAILIIVSTVVLITTKNRAMLAGLQKGRTVLVESIDTVLKKIQPDTVTDSSYKQQRAVEQNDGFQTPSSSEKPLLAVQEETNDTGQIPLNPASEQFSPETVTTTNNDKLPDAQKQPVGTKYPDKIDTLDAATTVAKEPIDSNPAVVNLTDAVKDPTDGQLRTVEQNGFTTPSSSEKPLLAVQEKQTEQFPPEPVTTNNNVRLPDTQELPVIAKSSEQIDILEAETTVVKQPLEDEPSVVNQTDVVTDSSYETQRAIEQNEPATPSSSEKPLLAVQEEQTEQFPSEPVTIASNTKPSDTQTIDVVTKSPDRVDTQETAITFVKEPLKNNPAVVNHTKQQLKLKSAPPDNSIHTSAENIAAAMKQVHPDMQSRIDAFLDNYIQAYQQRNLILFSSFFEADAIENGKPFSSELPTYKELFATASDISLKVEKTSWQQLDGKTGVQGIFKFHVQYNDSREFSGTGPIRFVLMNNNGSFQVSVLEYKFLTEN